MRGAGQEDPEHVIKFQATAPTSAADNEGDGDVEKSCIKGRDIDDIPAQSSGRQQSEEEGADELTKCAIPRPIRGVIAPVGMMVATTLAAS